MSLKTKDKEKEKEQKRNLLNTVTQRSQQNKEQRVNNITSTRMGKARITGCREQERVITDQLCYGCGSKEHKIQKCNKKSNIFVTNSERCKIEEEEMRGIMEEYGEVKSLKLRFHPNITINEAMICFSTEKEAQLAIREISTYKGWGAELYKPIKKSREFERQEPDNSNKEHEQRKNRSSTKQVELSHVKEEIKYIHKKTLDILLEGRWLETTKDNKEGSRKSNRNKSKNTETNKGQNINSNKEQEQNKKKVKEIKKKVLQGKRVRRSKRIKNALKNFKIYYQNVRGLKSKLDSLQEMIDDYQPALVCIVETHMQKRKKSKYQFIVLCTEMR